MSKYLSILVVNGKVNYALTNHNKQAIKELKKFRVKAKIDFPEKDWKKEGFVFKGKVI